MVATLELRNMSTVARVGQAELRPQRPKEALAVLGGRLWPARKGCLGFSAGSG